jgi:hypothetical protein
VFTEELDVAEEDGSTAAVDELAGPVVQVLRQLSSEDVPERDIDR